MKLSATLFCLFLFSGFHGFGETPFISGSSFNSDGNVLIRTHALKLNVDDMDKAISFYNEKLGFEIEDRSGFPGYVVLKSGEREKLILNRVKKLRTQSVTDTRFSFTLQVNDLDRTIERLKAQGVEYGEVRKEAVGNAVFIKDPFGRPISLMHQTIVKVEPFKEPRIYNFGFLVPDMQIGRDFYTNKLGFVVRSEKYLPLDLPLGHPDKSFAFMLHYRPGVVPVKNRYSEAAPFNTLIFETSDLGVAVEELKKRGVRIIDGESQKKVKSKKVMFEDPFGNVSELIEVAK